MDNYVKKHYCINKNEIITQIMDITLKIILIFMKIILILKCALLKIKMPNLNFYPIIFKIFGKAY